MKRLRLLRYSREELKKIVGYTRQEFGTGQAKRYKDEILRGCNGLAQEFGLSSARRFGELCVSKVAERHSAVYVETERTIDVYGFVHHRQNLDKALTRLATVRSIDAPGKGRGKPKIDRQ